MDETSTISRSRLKLVATTFDFWITGVAVASIGVCMRLCFPYSLELLR